MSWISEQREQQRADRVAAAEQARLNGDAKATRRIAEQAARAEQARAERAELARQRRANADARAARRAARTAALRAWCVAHLVDLLIYPLALASAVMAIPAMAHWGVGTYHSWTGAVLPVLSELGMWGFAFAVMVSRRHHPDRPVWALQLGIVVFAVYGAALNFAHGRSIGGIDTGTVMAAVSVAGVVAHQLVAAAPRRSRAERSAARIARLTARKVDRIRRVALRHAVAEIDAEGAATLIVAPGRYMLHKRRPWRRRGLVGAIVPGLPVDHLDSIGDSAPTVADEAAAWLADISTATRADTSVDTDDPIDPVDHQVDPTGTGPVGTLDRHADTAPESGPDSGDDLHRSTPDPVKGRPRGLPRTNRKGRTLDQLRSELAAAVADESMTVDPTSAESIRKALHCSPARARQLRDEHQTNPKGKDR